MLPGLALLDVDAPLTPLTRAKYRRIDAVTRAASTRRPAVAATLETLRTAKITVIQVTPN